MAQDFAVKYGCYLVLKSSRTVIATTEGRAYLNPLENLLVETFLSFAFENPSAFKYLNIFHYLRAEDIKGWTTFYALWRTLTRM